MPWRAPQSNSQSEFLHDEKFLKALHHCPCSSTRTTTGSQGHKILRRFLMNTLKRKTTETMEIERAREINNKQELLEVMSLISWEITVTPIQLPLNGHYVKGSCSHSVDVFYSFRNMYCMFIDFVMAL